MKDKETDIRHKIEEIVVCQIEEKSLTENTDIEAPKGNGDKRKKERKKNMQNKAAKKDREEKKSTEDRK